MKTAKYNAIDFGSIDPRHFLPLLRERILEAKNKIEAIKQQNEPPSFENTNLKIEGTFDEVNLLSNVFHSLYNAHTNDDLQQAALNFDPELAQFTIEILTDSALFTRVKAVYEERHQQGYEGEELRLIEKHFRDFVRSGALLDASGKERLKQIDEALARLAPAFSENVLSATNSFEMLLTQEEELRGLPISLRESAAEAAQSRGKDGWLFTLQAPSYLPFMMYSEHRPLREKMWRAYNSRCFKDQFDNSKVVLETVQLRAERAKLLGYASHAHFVLEERMAETPEQVEAFLNKLLNLSKIAAEKELKDLKAFVSASKGPTDLMPWDVAFYSERLKEQRFQFSEEALRPYFHLESVVAGVFEHARRLYGLNFRQTDEISVYQNDVKVYEVTRNDGKEFVGLLYTDFFPRETKRGGAWMSTFHNQGLFKGAPQRPHVSIVCNFTKPTSDKPSLLTYVEVKTLFHEFGHALHGLLSNCKYSALAGTNVYWDFVELPSQIMENWVEEEESLKIFARHYESGEALPNEMARRLKETSRFMAGMSSLRQINFAMLDMAWHGSISKEAFDLGEFERKATSVAQILPRIEGSNISTSFSHIFAGGYSAGYYSYKWAEVLDADAFELFKEKGLFNTEVSSRFLDNILSRGDSEHPMTLYKRFRGREPDPEALLRRDGFIS